MTNQVSTYAQSFSEALNHMAQSNPLWLIARQKEAMVHFSHVGFPSKKNDNWKYLQLDSLKETNFKWLDHKISGLDHQLVSSLLPREIKTNLLVFINGRISQEFSKLGDLPNGIIVSSLKNILEENPEKLKTHFSDWLPTQSSPFEALNTAFIHDGAFIELKEGTTIDTPIYLLFLSHAEGQPSASYPRNLILMGRNARASIIEHYAGQTYAPYLTNAVTEIFLNKGASLDHCKLQHESDHAFHIGSLKVFQETKSHLSSHSFSFGANLCRYDINATLNAPEVECNLNGLYLASQTQQADHHVRVNHLKPRGTSRILFKGIVNDHAKGVYNGKVIVHPDAQQTNAEQTNKNILLSENAEVDPKPEFEIYADDVKCSHGATVGQLDEDALFYMRARGMDETAARTMLTYGFASELVQKIAFEPLRAHVECLLASHFLVETRHTLLHPEEG